jgi:large subunit ribosomal protein L15
MNKSFEIKPVVLNVSTFSEMENGTILTPQKLVDLKLVKLLKGKVPKVKILANGEITNALTFKKFTISKAAIEKIEKAGGKVYIK